MIAGVLIGPWLFQTFQFQEFKIEWLGGLIVKGAGLPFFVSGIIGLIALALLLVFVEEPSRKEKENR